VKTDDSVANSVQAVPPVRYLYALAAKRDLLVCSEGKYRRGSFMKRFAFLLTILLGSLLWSVSLAAQPPSKAAQAKAVSAPPTDKEIAEAKSRGLVWTNPNTKVYHKGGEFYGKTASGTFMREGDAIKQYYRPSPDAIKETAKKAESPAAKAAAPSSKRK
jgi:hypothetical protein